jgi:hypothetical protein
MGKGMGIGRVRFVDRKVEAIIAIQAVLRAEPEEALMILDDGSNREVREPLFRREMLEAEVLRLGKKRGGEVEPENETPKNASLSRLFCHAAR